MPRFPAALAVLLTMSFCIGFNTIRYPVVWQMVAQSNPWPPPASPTSGAAEGSDCRAAVVSGWQTASPPRVGEAIHVAPGLSGPLPTKPATTEGGRPRSVAKCSARCPEPVPSPVPRTRVVCNGSMCCLVKESAPEPTVPHDTPIAAPPKPPAAPVAALPADAPEATVAAPLVPIVRPPKPAVAATVLTSAFETIEVDHDRLAQDKVRRLPTIDRVSPAQRAGPQEELPADQVPFYPSTGARRAG